MRSKNGGGAPGSIERTKSRDSGLSSRHGSANRLFTEKPFTLQH